MMVEGMAGGLPFPASAVMRGLLNPALTGRVLATLGDRARLFAPLFHNTVSPTIVHGGHKINVIPSEIALDLDGRLLPGFQPEDMLRELRDLLGDVELEVLEHDPGPADPDMGLFETLGSVLKESDPRGVPIPYVISGVTDARLFSLLGIQTYGFTPMQIPADLNFASTIHAADERVPVGAMDFGTDAVVRALLRFGEGSR
jgi:acetylornithine deacetylase/succinyl-diaminopimelate desuccinylase-like protein